ncbi:Nif11-like leader peptide family natural product precursor [Spirulina sp. CS-785/01]|uniref:Nif11-like leader peptide family natural product precursor n=1 Tax=Spirulina sp. CS-785/01 TaxID=3021716 RepID=UPI00232C1C43|nr:Nif11-like leader peptide family natural product precursor [Spirulina sp. CS-785/01]MDB9315667.1 Nif11-like leader peptide family natural product precursor [Spirulina sp. CS-785/01]
MAKLEVKRLFQAAQANPTLKENLNTAPDPETFVQRAQELGYDFTIEEWREMTGFSVEEFETEISEIPGI